MDEYISREKVLEIVNEFNLENRFDSWNDYSEMHDIISELEAADIQPVKHGRWISTEELYYNGMTKCSCCNEEYCIEYIWNLQGDLGAVNYCPNCGARMDLKDGEEK